MRCRYAPAKIIDWSFIPPRTHRFATLFNHLEWFWYTYVYTKVLLLLFFISSILSIVIVWQEVTVSVTDPDLSVFSWMVQGVETDSLSTQVVVFLPLGYEALVAYSTLFRLRLFHFYRLIPHQQTDSFSIMFSAAYLCRLAAPLSYNFMNFLHNQLAVSSFQAVMGTMDVVPFLGKHFNVYFPIVIGIVCLTTLFDVYAKIAACFHIQRFKFDEKFNDARIEEGAQIIQRERARLSGEGMPRRKTSYEQPVNTSLEHAYPVANDIDSHIENSNTNNDDHTSALPPSLRRQLADKYKNPYGSSSRSTSQESTKKGTVQSERKPTPNLPFNKRPVFESKPTPQLDDDTPGSSQWKFFGRDKRTDERKLLGDRSDDSV